MPQTILTIANQKGGVGKTTTAVALAHGLAMRGKRTLLIDMDPQGQCASFLGMPQEPGVFGLLVQKYPLYSLVREARPNLALLPGDRSTSDAGVILSTLRQPISLLAGLLKAYQFHYCIIDTAPSVSSLQAQALWAARLVVIPTACDLPSVQAVTELERTLLTLRSEYKWAGSLACIVPTFYDTSTSETLRVMIELQNLYPDAILQPIHRATRLRECSAEGKTIWEIDPSHRVADEYTNLIDYVEKL